MLEAETQETPLAQVLNRGKRLVVSTPGAIREWVGGDVRLVLAIIILSVMIILAIFAPWIAPHDPEQPNPALRLAPPSSEHWFGADVNGMDIFSRVIYAPRIDLTIAVVSVGISLTAGAFLGLLGGYFMGQRNVFGLLAELLNRFMDIIQAFPVFIVALALLGVLEDPGIRTVIIVLAILFSPIFFRYVRGEVLSIRERLFMEAGVAIGNPRWRLLFTHLLPNSITPALVFASVNMGFAILLTAGLSFVGAGVRPPTPEWGAMISVGRQQMVTGQWWPTVFPGIFIGLTVFSLAIIGESLRMRLEK